MNFKIRIAGAAIITMIIASVATGCNKDKSVSHNATSGSNITKTNARALEDDACEECGCTSGIDSAETFDVPFNDVGLYTSWTPVSSAFCGDGPQVTFEGQFNSIIRGAGGWTVGYLSNVPYDANLDTLSCATVTANNTPTVGNYIGNEGPTSCPTCPGYYNYSTGDITRLVTAFKCCPEEGKIKVYVIKVTLLDAYSNDGYITFNSKVVYEYKCYSCDWTGSCPSATARAMSSAPRENWSQIPAMFLKGARK